MSPKRALAILIVFSGILRLVVATALGLGNDEAYHFLYAVHPDLSYYDHPPMLAWVETTGLALSGALFSRVALRFGFIALFASSTWLMWRIASRWYGPRAGFFAALALNLTGYYGLAASTFALPDGPLLFFWLLTIDRLSVAIEQPPRNWPWVWVGLAWGGAMLSKYHAIFLPAGLLLLLIMHRPMRYWLTRTGPYLAVGLGLLVFSPVLIWNAERLGIVLVSGRQGLRCARAPARLPGNHHVSASWISLPLDLDPAVLPYVPRGEKLETPADRAPTPGSLSGCRAGPGLHGCRMFSAGSAALGADWLGLALPGAGRRLATALRPEPRALDSLARWRGCFLPHASWVNHS